MAWVPLVAFTRGIRARCCPTARSKQRFPSSGRIHWAILWGGRYLGAALLSQVMAGELTCCAWHLRGNGGALKL